MRRDLTALAGTPKPSGFGDFGALCWIFRLEFSPRYLYGSRQRIPAPLPADIRGVLLTFPEVEMEGGMLLLYKHDLAREELPHTHTRAANPRANS